MRHAERSRYRTPSCRRSAHGRCSGYSAIDEKLCGCPCHPWRNRGVGDLRVGDAFTLNGQPRRIRDMRHLSGGGKLLIFEDGGTHRLAAGARITDEDGSSGGPDRTS